MMENILRGVLICLAAFLLVCLGMWFEEVSIVRECEAFDAFKVKDVVYDCVPRRLTQEKL